MVIDLIVTNTEDGFTAEVPSVKGCESWAHNEDEAIQKALEMTSFYLNLSDSDEIKVDKARRKGNQSVYKLIFEKSHR
jgi:predicted RNase H-like HicB family nuclease